MSGERQKAYDLWQKAHGGRKPCWMKADWVCLTRAEKLLEADFLPTWRRFLADADAFYRGHSPRKFLHEADKWRPGSARRKWQPGDDW